MSPTPSNVLRTTEERLARLSVLQELTVTALDLFDPVNPEDPFLERVAERLGCLAALWIAIAPDGQVRLVGAAGLSEASREVPFEALPPGELEHSTHPFHYPELARADLLRWSFRLAEPAGGEQERHALMLWFDREREPPQEYLPAVERLVGVLATVLSHRRLARDLRTSYEELARAQLALVERERLAAIGEVAAVLAHEIRNPLAVIFNCVGALERHPDEKPALLAILAEEANRLNQIVSELLDFARPEEVRLSSQSLEDIVVGAVGAVRAAEPSPVEIELSVARSLPMQMLDGRLVRRAIINVVTNAVQAMPGGGRVIVRVVEETLGGRPAVGVEVVDEGPGIPDAIRSRMFEPFFTTKTFGVGLGLSIVKHVVEAHRGDLMVRCPEGQGTTFTIRLPVSP